MQSAPKPAPELLRELNAWHSTAIVVGTIIGSGIFLVPAEMMQAVGSARLVYLAWIVGGLLSFFGALTYAELGACVPGPAANTFTSVMLTGRCHRFFMHGRGSSSPSLHPSPA